MRLNVGCGTRKLPGYTGVDAVKRDAADIVAPADAIPLPDECAEEVLAVHLCEHILPWRLPFALREWRRLLKKGARLILEMPDLYKACLNIVEGKKKGGKHPDQLGLWALYGDTRTEDEHMLHRYAYSFMTLRPIVEAAGFVSIIEAQTVFHPCGREHRDFRLEARRPADS
jgi:predicted SAM-dependent methyltransferase